MTRANSSQTVAAVFDWHGFTKARDLRPEEAAQSKMSLSIMRRLRSTGFGDENVLEGNEEGLILFAVKFRRLDPAGILWTCDGCPLCEPPERWIGRIINGRIAALETGLRRDFASLSRRILSRLDRDRPPRPAKRRR